MVAATAVAVALASTVVATSLAAPAAKAPTWSAADIAKVAKQKGVAPFQLVYDVPKSIPHYKLGFVNPDLGNPFFATWSRAMKDAAKFYGVSFSEGNAATKYEKETDIYDTLASKKIDAVGAHPGNTVIAAKAKKAGMPFITIDSVVKGSSGHVGVPDVAVGRLAAKLVSEQLTKKVAGDWKGKPLFYVGLGVPGCTPCEVRPHVAFDELKKQFQFDGSSFISEYATPDVGQKFMTDLMTSHPNDAFVIVPLNDESLIGVLQALSAADRSKDALAVTLGGDPAGRKFLRENSDVVFAAIDFNPYGEAWNWVAASIAKIRHQSFKPYSITTVLTPQNVDTYYRDKS
jgi:ABC-type sugar transport system substrate-binding protein